MEHACRDRVKKRCAIWRFRHVRLFANARCKMHGARAWVAMREKSLFYKAFSAYRRAGNPGRGGVTFAPNLMPRTLRHGIGVGKAKTRQAERQAADLLSPKAAAIQAPTRQARYVVRLLRASMRRPSLSRPTWRPALLSLQQFVSPRFHPHSL
jgi:hypothetical protein